MPLFKKKPKSETKIVSSPYIPLQIDPVDLKPNGKLYSDETIERLTRGLAGKADGRYSKTRLVNEFPYTIKPPYGVIKANGKLYAVYRGKDKQLGKGEFGNVKVVQDLMTGEFVALKFLQFKDDPVNRFYQEENNERELGVLKEIQMAKFDFPLDVSTNKRTERHLMGQTLAPGKNMESVRTPIGSTPLILHPIQQLMMLSNVVNATKKLHDKGFVHRDLKIDNFIVDPGTNQAELIDFGVSGKVEHGVIKTNKFVGNVIGAAPENFQALVNNKNSYQFNEKTEVYGLGAALADQLDIIQPNSAWLPKLGEYVYRFNANNINPSDHVIHSANPNLPKDEASRFALLLLIKDMMSEDPKLRLTVAEAQKRLNIIIQTAIKAEEKASKNDRLKVATLDVDEFSKMTLKKQEEAIDHLKRKGITSIALCDNIARNPAEYHRIKQILDANGVVSVVPKIFVNPDLKEAQISAAQHFKQQFGFLPLMHHVAKTSVKENNIVLPKEIKANSTQGLVMATLANGKDVEQTFKQAKAQKPATNVPHKPPKPPRIMIGKRNAGTSSPSNTEIEVKTEKPSTRRHNN